MTTLIKGVNVIEVAVIATGSIFSFLFGDWSMLMGILLTLQGSDIFTGLLKGRQNKDIGSTAFLEGVKKKVGAWVLVIVAHMIDMYAFNDTPVAVTLVISYLIAGEGISITENLTELGVAIPPAITKYLGQLKDKTEEQDLGE